MKKVLIIATHPDDETFGCGGTLLKLKDHGCELHWLIITSVSKQSGHSQDFINRRSFQIKKVNKEFNFTEVYDLNIPTAQVESVPTGLLVQKISKIIRQVAPDTIFLPFHGDVHSDHRIIFHASYSCTKSFRIPSLKRVYMMETLSETEFAPAIHGLTFTPNTFVDISSYLDRKIDILKIYDSELEEHPFPRSLTNVRSVATYRGATAGCLYAESFMLLKDIW